MCCCYYLGNDGYDFDELFLFESVIFYLIEEFLMIRDVEVDDILDFFCSVVYLLEYYYYIVEEVNNVDFDE